MNYSYKTLTFRHVTFTHAAPDVTVNGTVTPVRDSEKLFSFTCVVNGADNLEAMFNFTLIAKRNGTTIHHEEKTTDTQFSHSFTAKASDAGRYTCQVIVTSSFLDKPIVSNTTVTFIIQSKPSNAKKDKSTSITNIYQPQTWL
jgi:hypothetical protein